MSRIPKWKIEKTKVKVVFRLQFHATNIPSTGWDRLFLSFISADTGKVTAKTNKANVRNGSCKWPDPIYEATRLLQDSRTKAYDDKLYKLVVAMGTARSSILGEVDVNLAEFAEALKPASVALPLRGCDFGTVIHVTAQLLTTKTGFREFEQQRETGVRSSQLMNQRSHDPFEVATSSSDIGSDKVNARVKLNETSQGLPSVEESAGSTEDYEDSSHASDGGFTEKNDPSGGHEISNLRSTVSGDFALCHPSRSPTPEKGMLQGIRLSTQGSNDWTHGWSSDYSVDNDLAEENNRLRVRLEVAESAFSQLKSEAKSLQHVTDELGTETQGLAQQLAIELMSGNQLTTEVSMLRTECANLKKELEEIKSAKLLQKNSDREASLTTTRGQENISGKLGNDVLMADASIHDFQAEWLQGLLQLESKLQQTRNNAFHGLQGSDLDFLLADLGALQRIIENLKEGVQLRQMKDNHSLEHLVPPSNAARQPSPGHDHESHKKNSGSTGMMEEKMCELLQKLEDSKTEKENLLEKMSQMERYYESFIHKLEESQKQTSKELENLKKEHNSCFYTVSVLQAQKQKMHEEMNDQLMRFVEERTALEAQNKELERRSVATETALKRVRWNYSAAVDRLQKDLELLSFQVLSMYESNETLAKQAFVEACESCPDEHFVVGDLCSNKDHGQYKPDIKHIGLGGLRVTTESQVFSAENGVSDSFIYKTDGQKNLLQALKNGELHKRSESELLEMYAAIIEWQVFSDVLRESHHTSLDIVKRMQGRLYDLEQQLHDSNDARESLVLKLNSALDQAKSLRESEAGYILKYDDLAVKNQILEAKLQDISVENALFMEKLAESERLVQEHKACESKYKACDEERKRFENLLMQESLQTSQLKVEIRSIMEEFKAMREELHKQCSINNDLQGVSTQLQDQLGDLCSKIISRSKEINISGFDEASLLQEIQSMDYTAVMASLELFQQQACQKVLQLRQEVNVLEEMNDILQNKSENSESELLQLKQKFQSDLDATTGKLNSSDELVEKLRQELQDMAQKFQISSEAQEKYSVTNSDLTSRLAQLEVELQHVNSENEVLLQKLQGFSVTVEEHERTKASLTDCEEDNRTLTLSLQSKADLLMQMENERRGLQDVLKFTDDNLLREKRLREELESAVASLTSQLGEKNQLLLSFNEQKELVHPRDRTLDLEISNCSMQDALSQSEQIQMELKCKNHPLHFQLSNVEDQLEEVLEAMLGAEIEASYMRSQVGEIVVELDLFRRDLEELQLKHKGNHDFLRAHKSSEADLADRNAKLETALCAGEIDLPMVTQEKEGLEHLIKRNEEALAEFTNIECQDTTVSTDNSKRLQKYQDEILELKILLASLEEQVDELRSTKDEVEILNMILRSKLEEQHVEVSLLQETENELANLKEQHRELTQKLSEQIMKTEEFKNLSIHLRELKEKAEAGRKEKEGSLFAMQESLRIAFIKEQYESKVQELKGQVFVSKKYAEEMLLKLQNALDEVETGRKNEIALAKRIEELSMKVSELEVEMQDLSADKRELSNAYDSIKTELECTALSFDCCKEEKQKVEDSLRGCNEERNRIKVELDLVKKLLENMALADHTILHDSSGSCTPDSTSIGQILVGAKSPSASKETSNATEDSLQSTALSSNLSPRGEDVEKCSVHEYTKAIPGSKNSENCHKDLEASLENYSTGSNSMKEHSKEYHNLAIDLNLFQKELEILKNENLSPLLPLDVNLIDPSLTGLERELSQLDIANGHLQTIFPSFKELPGSGNALERVLALELELAEALQAKKKTEILFQSSFLKQHNDEEAVFQSFRDINELIQDTIELKRRQVAVESELKEMQGRYSELSVQFAEVEGERQKLAMTLKSRTPRR